MGCSPTKPSIKYSVEIEGTFKQRTSQPRLIAASDLPREFRVAQYTYVGWLAIKVLRDEPFPRELALELGHARGCDVILMPPRPYAQYKEYDSSSDIVAEKRHKYLYSQFTWDKDEYRAKCYRQLSESEADTLSERRLILRERDKKLSQKKRLSQESKQKNLMEGRDEKTLKNQKGANKAQRDKKLVLISLEVNREACDKAQSSFDFLACRIAGQMILPEFDNSEFAGLPKDRQLGEKYLLRSCMEHPLVDTYGYGTQNCQQLIEYFVIRKDARLQAARIQLAKLKRK